MPKMNKITAPIIVYFLTTILFAIVYTYNSSGFYHSNLHREKEFRHCTLKIENVLADEINQHRISLLQPPQNERDVYDNPTNISIIEVNSNNINILISSGALYDHKGDIISYWVKHPATLRRSSSISTKFGDSHGFELIFKDLPLGAEFDIEHLLGFDFTKHSEDISKKATLFGWGYNKESNYGVVSLNFRNIEFSDCVKKLFFMKAGNASLTDHKFWRMLYFSAVTGTTIGYGDITPITTAMRLIITIQTLLCLVIFSWFINNLARINE
jgi:hypothetical protein